MYISLTHQALKTAPLGLMVMNFLQQKIQVLLVLLLELHVIPEATLKELVSFVVENS